MISNGWYQPVVSHSRTIQLPSAQRRLTHLARYLVAKQSSSNGMIGPLAIRDQALHRTDDDRTER